MLPIFDPSGYNCNSLNKLFEIKIDYLRTSMRQERLDLSVGTIYRGRKSRKIKSSSAMDDLVNKVAKKRRKKYIFELFG